jgi:hypothetical protein
VTLSRPEAAHCFPAFSLAPSVARKAWSCALPAALRPPRCCENVDRDVLKSRCLAIGVYGNQKWPHSGHFARSCTEGKAATDGAPVVSGHCRRLPTSSGEKGDQALARRNVQVELCLDVAKQQVTYDITVCVPILGCKDHKGVLFSW